MQLGPFNILELEKIKELLEAKSVAYEMLVDEAQEAQMVAQDNGPLRSSLELKIVYFEIADDSFKKIKDVLENYGIVESSDGAFELGGEDEE